MGPLFREIFMSACLALEEAAERCLSGAGRYLYPVLPRFQAFRSISVISVPNAADDGRMFFGKVAAGAVLRLA